MSQNVRLFFAMPIEADDSQRIHQWVAPVAAQHRFQWVSAANYHVTLAFLGDTEASLIPELIAYASEKLDTGLLPLTWSLNHVSRFSGGVLYLGGFQEPSALHRFARALSFLVPLHDQHQPFVPHVTIARHAEPLETPAVDLSVCLQRVSLMQSVTGPAGVRYETLHSWHRPDQPRTKLP